MNTIQQRETLAILQLKEDYDTAIKERDLWKAEAERWRKLSQVQLPENSDKSPSNTTI